MRFSGVPVTELGPAFQSPSEVLTGPRLRWPFRKGEHVTSVPPAPSPGGKRVCVFPWASLLYLRKIFWGWQQQVPPATHTHTP